MVWTVSSVRGDPLGSPELELHLRRPGGRRSSRRFARPPTAWAAAKTAFGRGCSIPSRHGAGPRGPKGSKGILGTRNWPSTRAISRGALLG